MTPSQRETLVWIEAYMRRNFCAPTRDEIADALGLSVSAARLRVLALVRAGVLTCAPGARRGMRLVGIQPWPHPTTAAEAAAAMTLVEPPRRRRKNNPETPAPPAER